MERKLGLILILILTSVLGACSKPDNKSNPGASGVLGPGTTIANCSSSTTTIESWITESTLNDSSFTQQIADFVSASMNPFELGNLSAQAANGNGVKLRLVFNKNTNGGPNSLIIQSFLLSIYDSYALSGSGPIQISNQSSSQLQSSYTATNGTGSISILFQDEYGQINLQGQIINNQLQAIVTYQNHYSYDDSAPKSGRLGNFSATLTCL